MANGPKADMIKHFGEELCKVANDRTRLQIAFEQTLGALGVPKPQIEKIIVEVRAADFTRLYKTLKIT